MDEINDSWKSLMDVAKAGNKKGLRVRTRSLGDLVLTGIALLSVCVYGMYIVLSKGLFGVTPIYFFIDGVPKSPFGALIYLSVVLIAIGTVMMVRYRHRLEMSLPFLHPEFRTIRLLATALPFFALGTLAPTVFALGYYFYFLIGGY